LILPFKIAIYRQVIELVQLGIATNLKVMRVLHTLITFKFALLQGTAE